jgi:hypothetical protein
LGDEYETFDKCYIRATIIAAPSARADVMTMTSDGTTYQFDPVAASADFTNFLQSSNTSITCSPLENLVSCGAFNTPNFSLLFPSPPASDATQTQSFAINLDDIFFSGGSLAGDVTTYQQITNDCEAGINGFGTWCLDYTYIIEPNVSSVAPLSDWTPVTTPIPGALPFATGLGALGLLGWRRKRELRTVA